MESKIVKHPVCIYCGGKLWLDLVNAIGEYDRAESACKSCGKMTAVVPIIQFLISPGSESDDELPAGKAEAN